MSFNLEPIIIPDVYMPLSPSESGYSSPAESDASALFTPNFPDQHDHLAFDAYSPHSNSEPDVCGDRHNDSKSFKCRVPSDSPSSPGSFCDITLNSDASLPVHVHAHSSQQPSPQSKHKARNTYPLCTASSSRAPISTFNLDSTLYSSHFPEGHRLNTHFVRQYELEDELGSGGYGFVMTARHRLARHEVAVKFIIKDKVPDHAWMVHEVYGKLPTEVMLLSVIDHENIVKCLDLFEDALYFYLVQELHGSPWDDDADPEHHANSRPSSSVSLSTPFLTPSASMDSLSSIAPSTPSQPSEPTLGPDANSSSSSLEPPRPKYSRRSSHDLFECIEQSEHKRLTEDQARHVFAQIVDAVHYLDEQGVSHRDIKDENIVIDKDLKVKLIDFGSATFVDPAEERPFYTLFYGTTAYAASEILQKKPYQAAPAEVWTLGVLLSYLLTGTSPFPTVKHAISGRITLPDHNCPSVAALDLMHACLDPDPKRRATIAQIKEHYWLGMD